MSKSLARKAVVFLLAGLLTYGNLSLATRDGSLTASMPSFDVLEIIRSRLWMETPVQVLNTFMLNGTYFSWAGEPSMGGVSFGERLKRNFGSDRVDESTAPVDLREFVSSDVIGQLEDFVQTQSYRSLGPCPHNENLLCTFAIGWDRDRTKEVDIQMLITRISETTYLIVDDSTLEVAQE